MNDEVNGQMRVKQTLIKNNHLLRENLQSESSKYDFRAGTFTIQNQLFLKARYPLYNI
jgi:hypothetical protein